MVKQGYKQTEIGVLPESWDTITFEECFSILPNNTLSRAELNYNGGEVRNIHYGDILVKFPAVLDCSAEGLPYINKENVAKASKGFLRDGDLIMADTAEDVIVGKSTEVIGIGDSKVVSGLHTIPCRPKDAEMFAPKWLGYFINHCTYHDQLIPYITGIKVSSVSKSAISNTVIAVPPKPEQEAIAEALSDIDTLIVNLEKLIAKKKAIKQGTMHELLTGKRRLPGFDGQWQTYKLDDLLKYEQPTKYIVKSTEYSEKGIPVLTAGKSLLLGYTVEDEGIYENLPVIIFDDFVTSSKYIDFKFKVKSSAMKMLTLRNERMNLRLIFALMQMIDFTPVDHQRHWISQYSQFEINLPSDIKEQNTIATILFDIDNEIEMLQKKLAKAFQLKQGMMSELLTGRIRLIDKEDV